MQTNSNILITGASGMVGFNLVTLLQTNGYQSLQTPSHQELDLQNQIAVNEYFEKNRPEYVFHLAARVGGIHANSLYPAEFIYQNTIMHSNIFNASQKYGVKKICFPGSACTYPKLAKQPIIEADLLSGFIEPTNIAYATAKINGIVMAQSYAKQYGLHCIIPMPTNIYGIKDNFNDNASHVIPALIKKFYLAKRSNAKYVELWGDGTPTREFLFSTDCASGLLFLMQNYHSEEIINLSTMDEISIFNLAQNIASIVEYQGEIKLMPEKPNGAPRKCLDNTKIKMLGWQPRVHLQDGLRTTYQYFLTNIAQTL